MKHGFLFLAAAAILLAGAASCTPKSNADQPLNIIFETDLGNDVDDALALDLLYKYVESGRINLLAIMINKDGTAPAGLADILNTWYGHDIPIGIIHDGADCETDAVNYARAVVEMKDESGNPLFARSIRDYTALPDAHILYRQILAAAPDHSVHIVSVGFSTNLSRLLHTPADAVSPLNGRDLVAQKVASLTTMAGNIENPNMHEYNVVKDIPACRDVFENWPTEIVTSPFEVGNAILYPGASIENDLSWGIPHPVAEAYKAYMPMPYDRQTWDLTAVLYAVEGPSWFTLSAPGTITVSEAGSTTFTPSGTTSSGSTTSKPASSDSTLSGRHRYLSVTPAQASAIRSHFLDLIPRKPARFREGMGN